MPLPNFSRITTCVFRISACLICLSAHAQNYSLSFNGTSQYVDCGSNALLNATSIQTMEGWIKFNNFTGIQEILSRSVGSSGIELVQVSGSLSFYCMKNGANTSYISYPTTNLAINTWYHVAACWDGSTKESMTLYVNGKSVGTRTDIGNINSGITNPAGSFRIGQWSQALDRYFSGIVDQVRIWSVQRTAAQIKTGMYSVIPVSSANLTAYYSFDDGSGSTLTNSTANSGLNGTLQNSPAWVASPIQFSDGALSFDGTDDQVIAPANSVYDLVSGTIECWAKAASFPAGVQQHLVGVRSNAGSRYSFHLASNQVGMWNNSSYATVAHAFNTGQWYHLAFVCNGSSTIVYVDGTSIGTIAQGFGSMTGLTLVMGISKNVSTVDGEPFSGSMDEVRIWNVQRTQAQIQSTKDVTLTGSESGLVALFSFNQGAAAGTDGGLVTAVDGTSNNNHATLSNFSLTGATSNWVAHALTPLPVQFGYFTAARQVDYVMLNWETEQEQNSRVFNIQRSPDGLNFSTIGELPAAGNSPVTKDYSFADLSPLPGNNYYRILEVDLDGRSLYSGTTLLSFPFRNDLRIAPNPAHGTVNFNMNSMKPMSAAVSLTDVTGRVLISKAVNLEKGANQLRLDVGGLTVGYYVLRVINAREGISAIQQLRIDK
ncbi:MAG TPA: LamG-like jellyroll fold domain-containing protein [Puia sp.]|nr:LamG-like jellyroll fold domain-containing protein [Puia sp.]